jgi:hypothetical protein
MRQMKRVAIAVNMNKAFDRQVVAGIARFARQRDDWSLYTDDESLAKRPTWTTAGWPGPSPGWASRWSGSAARSRPRTRWRVVTTWPATGGP